MRHLFQIVGSFPTLIQRVAMHLRCGGIFNDCFIIQSLLIETEGEFFFENRSTFGEE